MDWTDEPPRHTRPLPLALNYIYTWERVEKTYRRKACWSVRGDLMKEGVHLFTTRKQCPTTTKATARTLFDTEAAHEWKIEHMDKWNSYVHEKENPPQPIYVKELPRSNWEYKHGQAVGRLVRKLWGGKSAWHDYTESILQHLQDHNYKSRVVDPCLLHAPKKEGPVLIAIAVD